MEKQTSGAPAAAERERKNFSGRRLITAFVFLAACAAAFFCIFTPGVSVLWNGASIGVTDSEDTFYAAVAEAEQRATALLGRSYFFDLSGVSFTQGTAAKSLDVHGMADALLEQAEGVEHLYMLYLDGEALGGAADKAELDALLSGLLRRHETRNSISVSFNGSLMIRREFVVAGSVRPFGELAGEILAADRTDAPLLPVRVVERLTYVTDIVYSVDYIVDESLYEGEYLVLSPGENGEARVTEELTTIGGHEYSSVILENDVLKKAVSAVVTVGTRVLPRWTSTGTYIWPTDEGITDHFGDRILNGSYSYHRGLDLGADYGDLVWASDGGEVIYAGWYGDYGYLVEIRHDNGTVTYYAHNAQVLVHVGQKVAQGDSIALAGDTGYAFGVHCHFELRINGITPVDPELYLTPR